MTKILFTGRDYLETIEKQKQITVFLSSCNESVVGLGLNNHIFNIRIGDIGYKWVSRNNVVVCYKESSPHQTYKASESYTGDKGLSEFIASAGYTSIKTWINKPSIVWNIQQLIDIEGINNGVIDSVIRDNEDVWIDQLPHDFGYNEVQYEGTSQIFNLFKRGMRINTYSSNCVMSYDLIQNSVFIKGDRPDDIKFHLNLLDFQDDLKVVEIEYNHEPPWLIRLNGCSEILILNQRKRVWLINDNYNCEDEYNRVEEKISAMIGSKVYITINCD